MMSGRLIRYHSQLLYDRLAMVPRSPFYLNLDSREKIIIYRAERVEIVYYT